MNGVGKEKTYSAMLKINGVRYVLGNGYTTQKEAQEAKEDFLKRHKSCGDNTINRSYNGLMRKSRIGVSGYRGVRARSDSGFEAGIKVNGKKIYLGIYKSAEEAYQVRLEAEKLYKDPFVNEVEEDLQSAREELLKQRKKSVSRREPSTSSSACPDDD